MSNSLPLAAVPAGLPDPAALAQLASAMFAALPGATQPDLPPGFQAPVNIAPAGSPLASPAGFGPNVPGTPVPLGQLPGSNLLPGAPTPVLSLAHRLPAARPHALASNQLPDTLTSVAPAFEPRLGSAALGVPPAGAASEPQRHGPAAGASPYGFLRDTGIPGHALAAQPAAARADLASTASPDGLDALSRAPFALPSVPRAVAPPVGSVLAAPAPEASAPHFYFVDGLHPAPGITPPARSEGLRPPQAEGSAHPAFDVQAVRRDFPILQERVNGRPLVWFDNAATTHKPQAVIDRLAYFYAHENSNIHRAAHALAARATDAYEGARERVRRFINAPDVNEVVFVRGTTEAINLVAKSWGEQHVGAGDEIIVSHLEHHANIVPWQQLAAAKGAKLRVIPVDDRGQVLLEEYSRLLNDRTRIVSVTQVSNALGTVVPVKEIVALAHRAGAKALVDGAQSVSHLRTDVQDLDADFFVFSGHKVFGPTGIGVLWGKRAVLEDMPPWQGGGNMIADVSFEKTVYQGLPNKFEAGTGNIADAVGLGAALDYVTRIGIENIARYEHALLCHGMQALASIPGLRLIGTAPDKASVMSFVLAGYSTEEVGRALNEEGIAVRTGHHCAQPILRRFGVETTVRPSLAFYNTVEEIDHMVHVVRRLASQRPQG